MIVPRSLIHTHNLGKDFPHIHLPGINQVDCLLKLIGAGAGAADVHFLAGNGIGWQGRLLLGPACEGNTPCV